MNVRRLLSSSIALLLSLPAVGQDMPDMSPAKERLKFGPLVGNWAGEGTVTEPGPSGPVTKAWTATGSYRWVMGGHWLQEDFTIHFAGMQTPLVFRSYWGWDRERGRYVGVAVSNEGGASVVEPAFLPDGTMVTIVPRVDHGMSFVERSTVAVAGDKMTMQMDLMLPQGDQLRMVSGAFQKVDKVPAPNADAAVFMGAPVREDMQKLGRIAGVYDVVGEMIPAPGAPSMTIRGTDTYTKLWQGSVVHVRTEGSADGAPDVYEMHAYFAWDGVADCMKLVFVSNMGEVGAMDCRWSGAVDLVSTMSGTWMGEPVSQHYVTTFDAAGRCRSAKGWTVLGTRDPMVSFRATYEPKR